MFTEGRKTKEYDLRGEAAVKIWILQPCTLKAHCVCLESLSVMSRMRNVAVWFFTHAAGSSISGNISHTASLTPSALLQYPHIFPSFRFFPLHSSFSIPLLPLPFLFAAPPTPNLNLSLPSSFTLHIHPPSFIPPPTIFFQISF